MLATNKTDKDPKNSHIPSGPAGRPGEGPPAEGDGPPGEGEFPTQGKPSDIVAGIQRYREIGVSHIVFDVVPESVDVAIDTMDRFAEEVRPVL